MGRDGNRWEGNGEKAAESTENTKTQGETLKVRHSKVRKMLNTLRKRSSRSSLSCRPLRTTSWPKSCRNSKSIFNRTTNKWVNNRQLPSFR